MSVVWSGVTESGAVVPVQVDSLGRVIATTGEPPGPPVIEYNGASAWGDIASDGALNGGMNVASVRKTGTGLYYVVFTTPMPNANYSVVVGGASSMPRDLFKAADGFTIETRDASGNVGDASSSFAVFSTNALPPKAGTGTDAWGTVDQTAKNGACNFPASFNVASVTRTGMGKYDVVFITPMPSDRYCVLTNLASSSAGRNSYPIALTTNGFSINIRQTANGDYGDSAFNFAVNATSATLPLTVTQEQIVAVINNWQKTADTLSTKDAVEMNGPVRFAGGKAGVTSTGEFYFTPGPGSEKYLLGVDNGEMQLRRIDSVY